eukprot:297720_1
MGNQLQQQEAPSVQEHIFSRTKKRLLSKARGNRDTDDFIISHHRLMQSKVSNGNMKTDALDQRRTVFVSLIGLYQTFSDCPSHILYSALLIIPLKREWIVHPSQHVDALSSHFVSQFCSYHQEPDRVERFRQLLLWKDTQNLVFWCLDEAIDQLEEPRDGPHPSIDPFWQCLSRKLCGLYDPVHRQNYNPLVLDPEWWSKHNQNQFGVHSDVVCTALRMRGNIKYKAMQEILCQSNSRSLNVVVWYGQRVQHAFVNVVLRDDGEDDQEEGEWFISTDYDPYDLE